MWQCPKCNREFKNTNQSHYCTKAESINDYIAMQATEVQSVMQKVCEVIREAVPGCTEVISCHMPTFKLGSSRLIQFAAHKNHLGFYPSEYVVETFAGRLSIDGYKFNKGCIHFPWSKPVPYDLIAEMAQHRAAQLN